MSKKWAQEQEIDRSDWPDGPWNDEVDYHEWTTRVGYEAYAARLETGAWYVALIAPYPKDGMKGLALSHSLRDKRYARCYKDRQDTYEPGMISKSDIEGFGEWIMSMEHYDAPLPSRWHDWSKGPYKTLPEVIEICESMAQDIFDIIKEGTYVDYFKH